MFVESCVGYTKKEMFLTLEEVSDLLSKRFVLSRKDVKRFKSECFYIIYSYSLLTIIILSCYILSYYFVYYFACYILRLFGKECSK